MSCGSVCGFLFVFLPLETKEQFQAVRAIVVVTVCQDDKVQIKERAERQHLETSAKKQKKEKGPARRKSHATRTRMNAHLRDKKHTTRLLVDAQASAARQKWLIKK